MRILIFLILFSTSLRAQTKDEYKDVSAIAAMERDAHTRILLGNRGSAASGNFDVNYYRCEWSIDPSARYISGSVTAYYTMTAAGSNIVFDLMSTLVTDSVKQRGSHLVFTRPGDAVSIDLPGTTNTGTLDSVTIYYKGIPANTGFGSFIQSMHAGVPVMWTLSEPYGSRDWWPCKNGLDDKADSIDLFITHPVAYKAAANGMLQSETVVNNGTSILTHWKHRYPIVTYLVCVAVTNYDVFNNSVQLGNINVPMVTYCYPESRAAFEAGTQNTLDAMQFFHRDFGDYPFIKEKYGHVQFGWGGGMEHQTSTFIVNTSESLVAHELAHQWFGDMVTCSSWKDIWLNEGFATYLARYYMEQKYPATALSNRQNVINNITSSTNGSVKVNDTTSVGRIFSGRLSYNKGSYLVNMLRFKLGDTAFFRGIRNYLQHPSLQYGFVSTADLKVSLEAASGQDLGRFFSQWYEGEGYPSYNVQWSPLGSSSVTFTINQVTSDPSVSFFEMPVPLLFKNATQQKMVVVNHTASGQNFIESLGFIPDTVLIDPALELISRNNNSEKITLVNSGIPVVEIYPNPIQEPFTVYLHDFNETIALMQLYNMAGQLVYRQQIALINGAEIIHPNLQHLAKGQYLLRIQSGKFVQTKSILK